ncbi:hypothetical protein EON66_01005 [archaeon]|nr:MAG: hypothetical protein EON66_01005 [archaeon]
MSEQEVLEIWEVPVQFVPAFLADTSVCKSAETVLSLSILISPPLVRHVLSSLPPRACSIPATADIIRAARASNDAGFMLTAQRVLRRLVPTSLRPAQTAAAGDAAAAACVADVRTTSWASDASSGCPHTSTDSAAAAVSSVEYEIVSANALPPGTFRYEPPAHVVDEVVNRTLAAQYEYGNGVLGNSVGTTKMARWFWLAAGAAVMCAISYFATGQLLARRRGRV